MNTIITMIFSYVTHISHMIDREKKLNKLETDTQNMFSISTSWFFLLAVQICHKPRKKYLSLLEFDPSPTEFRRRDDTNLTYSAITAYKGSK